MITPVPRAGNHRDKRATEILAREAARFISEEAGPESLITVTRAESRRHGEQVTIFVSVFPVEKAGAALALLARRREAFSDYLKERTRLHALPRVDFALEPNAS